MLLVLDTWHSWKVGDSRYRSWPDSTYLCRPESKPISILHRQHVSILHRQHVGIYLYCPVSMYISILPRQWVYMLTQYWTSIPTRQWVGKLCIPTRKCVSHRDCKYQARPKSEHLSPPDNDKYPDSTFILTSLITMVGTKLRGLCTLSVLSPYVASKLEPCSVDAQRFSFTDSDILFTWVKHWKPKSNLVSKLCHPCGDELMPSQPEGK